MFFVRRAPRAAAFVTTAATVAMLAAGAAATSAHAVVGPDLQITGLRLAPATVDVTKSVNDVALVMKVTDNGTGTAVDGADVTAECLTGCPLGTLPLTNSSLAFQAGPVGNRTVTVSLHVPVATPASARWVIDNVVLHNFSSASPHDRVYTDANLTSGGFTQAVRTFSVASAPDTTPPALVGAPTITPASVNVTKSDQLATFLLHLSDNSNASQSGVDHGSITLASGAVTKTFNFTTNNNTDADPTTGTLVKGSPYDGFYRFTESFTALDKGTWTISEID